MTSESVRSRDPAGTKRQVLEAAEVLFSARGFAGTSIRDIALASGVSHPLIQHHFLTKEGLYRAVLRQCSEEFAARFPEAEARTDESINLGAEMTRIFEFVRNRERLVRMVGWARLEGRTDLFPDQNKARETLIRRIESGQRLGSVRTDITAGALVLMLEALIIFWIENRHSGALGDAGAALKDSDYLEKAILLFQRGAAPDLTI